MLDEDDWTDLVPSRPSMNDLKNRAHEAFDPLWKRGIVSRRRAYVMLAAALKVPEPQAHMRVMSRENLERVPQIAERLCAVLTQWPDCSRD